MTISHDQQPPTSRAVCKPEHHWFPGEIGRLSPIKLPEINETTLRCEKAKMWPRRTETEELRGWNQLNSQPHRVSAGAELCKKEKGAGSETFTFSFLRKRRIKKKQELARPPFSPKGKFFCYQMFTPQQEAEAAQQSEMGGVHLQYLGHSCNSRSLSSTDSSTIWFYKGVRVFSLGSAAHLNHTICTGASEETCY